MRGMRGNGLVRGNDLVYGNDLVCGQFEARVFGFDTPACVGTSTWCRGEHSL